MAKTALPKAERAIISAHEAGMHDRKPTPATCRSCAMDESAQRAFGDLLVIAPKKPVRRARANVLPLAPHPKARPADKPMAPDLEPTEGFGLIEPKAPKAPKAPRKPRQPRVKPEAPEATPVVVPADLTVIHTSREGWLMAGVEELRPAFEEAGYPVPEVVRVSVGWPGGRGKKAGVIGQCWPTSLAGDSVHHIFISPVLKDPGEVIATLAHELAHASVEKGSKHRGPFVKVCKALGLVGPWTATKAGPEFSARLTELLPALGLYDHGGLSQVGKMAVQTTRMLKVECQDCGCILRMTSKWIAEAGLPTCGCGGEMKGAA